MGEDYYKPPAGGENSDSKSASPLGKRKKPLATAAIMDHLLGPICPICAKALGPSASNQALNDHIDWCLNKDAISEASKRTPKKAKGLGGDDTAKRKPLPGTRGGRANGNGKRVMMGWLKKEG